MRKTPLAIAGVFILVGVMVLTAPVSAKPPVRTGRAAATSRCTSARSTRSSSTSCARAVSTSGTRSARSTGRRPEVETVLTERQAARLASKGVKLEVKRVRGKAASQVLREQAAAGWTAFRSYSEPGGIRDEIAADRRPLTPG